MKHHGEALRRLVRGHGGSHQGDLVAQLKDDYTCAKLRATDRTMLDYAANLTRAPSSVTERDVEKLRGVGFSDRAILDIAQITAYFAFVNRIAEGLGVALEDHWDDQ